jgi:hypothetical protein
MRLRHRKVCHARRHLPSPNAPGWIVVRAVSCTYVHASGSLAVLTPEVCLDLQHSSICSPTYTMYLTKPTGSLFRTFSALSFDLFRQIYKELIILHS